MPSLPQFLMNPPPLAPAGAALMWSPVNNSMFYASGNRGVILPGQYLWPIDPNTLAIGPNVYPLDYPWEDQITGMGYWAGNGSRFIFAERNYANLWSTDLMGGDVHLVLNMITEHRGIAIVGDFAYLPGVADNSVLQVSLSTNSIVQTIAATDISGPVSRTYGMTTHPITGEIWGAWDAVGAPFEIYFGVLNVTSGFYTRSCNGPFAASVSSIAFDGEGRLWMSIGGEPPGDLYRYDGGTPCLCPPETTTTTTAAATSTTPLTTSPYYTNNKVYVAYDTNPNRNFAPNDLYIFGNFTQLGLMDLDNGIIEFIAPINVDWNPPFRYYVRNIVMGPDNVLYGVSEWILSGAGVDDRFLKINTTTGDTQIICPFIGAFFPYKTSSLLITKDGLVYFKAPSNPPSYVQLLNVTSCTLTNVGVPFNSTNGVEYDGKLYFTYDNQVFYMTLPDYNIYTVGYYNLPYNVTETAFMGACIQDRCSAPSGIFPYANAYGVTSLRTMYLPDPRDMEFFAEFDFTLGTMNIFMNRTLNGNDEIVYDMAMTYYYNLTGPPSPPIAKKKKRDSVPVTPVYVAVQSQSYLFTYDPGTMTVTPVTDLGFPVDRLFKDHVQSGTNIHAIAGGGLVCSGVTDKVIGSDTAGNVAYTISETTLSRLYLGNCSSEVVNSNLTHNCVNVSATFQDSVYCITPQNEFVSLLTDTVVGTVQLQMVNNQLFEYQGELIFFYNENVFRRVNVTTGEFMYPDLQLSFVFGKPTTPWQFMQS